MEAKVEVEVEVGVEVEVEVVVGAMWVSVRRGGERAARWRVVSVEAW